MNDARLVTSFYRDGYSTLIKNDPAKNVLLTLLQNEHWKKDAQSNVLMPSWVPEIDFYGSKAQRERQAQDKLMRSTPVKYKKLVEVITKSSPVFSALKKIVEIRISHFSMWNGVEKLGWHWDGYDSGDIVLLMYLNEEQNWSPQDGGRLGVGYRNLDDLDMGFERDECVREIELIPPENGREVWLNNQNPLFVHKTTPLITERNRYTISVSLSLARE